MQCEVSQQDKHDGGCGKTVSQRVGFDEGAWYNFTKQTGRKRGYTSKL